MKACLTVAWTQVIPIDAACTLEQGVPASKSVSKDEVWGSGWQRCNYAADRELEGHKLKQDGIT